MRKSLDIALKDLRVTCRDRASVVLLVITPFALTLTIGFAFGGLGGGGGGSLSAIPLALVNHDEGEFGAILVATFETQELGDLVAPILMDDDAQARAAVDADELAAAVVIPADFSASLTAATMGGQRSVVELYANPTRPVSVGVVQGIVDEFLGRMAGSAAAAQVSIAQLVEERLISSHEILSLAGEIGERAWQQVGESQLIAIRSEVSAGGGSGFDWATYMTPSMAILFLMFTVTAGGRSILAERDEGTLPRLLVSPTGAAQVIGGKMLGTFLTGVAQLAILITASSLLFGIRWGSPGSLAVIILALVAAATCWGALLAAYARTPAQANALGTMLTLVFGALAGNFVPRQLLPKWLQTLSYISPNAWGLEAFEVLIANGSLSDLVAPLVALLVMSIILFGVSLPAFRRQVL